MAPQLNGASPGSRRKDYLHHRKQIARRSSVACISISDSRLPGSSANSGAVVSAPLLVWSGRGIGATTFALLKARGAITLETVWNTHDGWATGGG